MLIHVIGATGRSGRSLCHALQSKGMAVVPVVRNPARWDGTPQARIADLTDPAALTEALRDAERIVSCAHARHAAAILDAAPRHHATRFVFLGSTRRYTKWPDDHGKGVQMGEAAFLASDRNGVILHPTMIYGAQGEDNVQRLAALLSRLPFAPLPNGGRALVQPIHQDDVTRAIEAALAYEWHGPHAMIIAGPAALPYADFLRAVTSAAKLRLPRVLNVPAWLLRLASVVTCLPGLPRIRSAEIRRLTEDKAFDIAPMQAILGVVPISLSEGLSHTFGSK